jgi:hypothetical protein
MVCGGRAKGRVETGCVEKRKGVPGRRLSEFMARMTGGCSTSRSWTWRDFKSICWYFVPCLNKISFDLVVKSYFFSNWKLLAAWITMYLASFFDLSYC